MKRLQKSRAAAGFAAASFLHARTAEDLADRLLAVNRTFGRVLALGGAAAFARAVAARPELSGRIGFLAQADVAAGLVERPGLAVDPEAAPFAPGSFDLIVSTLALHWVNDLPGALTQLRLALKPDGLFLGAMFAGDTLTELRACLLMAETEITGGAGPRVAPFADLRDLGGLLQRAGFALPVADVDRVPVRYGEPLRLLADLRAMGETAALAERPQRALTRGVLLRAMAIYRERFGDAEGKVPATFDIATITGWAPHESQQKPLRPGSAKARLADALGVQERPAGEKAG